MSSYTTRSFVSGELDPALHHRVDLAKYQSGLKTCLNFFMRSQGGLYNRPGTRFVGEVKDSTKRTRLIPFSFNTEQTYILEFGHLVMRVIKDGEYVLNPAATAIYELVTPYTESDLFDTEENVYMLQFTQTADVMTLTHRGHPVKELSRTDHNVWTLSTVNFASSVTAPQFTTFSANVFNVTFSGGSPSVITVTTATAHGAVTGYTVSISGVVGTTELNGNRYRVEVIDTLNFRLQDITTGSYVDGTGYGAYVSGGVVTRPILSNVGGGPGTYGKTYRYVVTATDADGVESLASDEGAIFCFSISSTYGVRLQWGAVTGAEYYTVYKDTANGTRIYGFIGDTFEPAFEDYNVAPDGSRTPPEENTPISTASNYPATVGYRQQRRLFANTTNKPQTMFATQIGIFNSLRSSRPTRDDDAIEFTLNSRQINDIRHIIDLEDLILMTAGAEYRVTEGQDFVLTPSTIGSKAQSYSGASWVRPVTVGDSIVFVQEKGSRIRDLNYSTGEGKYGGADLSIMSEHLFSGRTVVEMAYAPEPYGILWCVMSDGALLGMTFQKEHQVWGWHRHETDGEFESVATIREGNRDAVYFIVKRNIDGNDVRYVERMEPRVTSSVEDAFFVDCGLTYDSTPATTISGLDHLEGEEVTVLADGNVVTGLTVSSGEITLPIASSVVQVGLGYTSRMITLGLDSPGTTLQGRKKNVVEVTLQFADTRGGWVGPDVDSMTEIKPRYESDGYDPIALKTIEEEIAITADWNDTGEVVVEQRSPLPMAILALTPEFDVG